MGKQGENLDFWNFQLECIHGKSGGKILWQPRIECWYDDKIFLGQELPGAFRGKNLPEIYRELGCSNRIYEYNSCFQAVDAPDIHREERRLSDLETEYIIHTPVGTISSVFQENTSNPGRYPKKWWVENTKDLKVMGYILKHQKWIWREDIYQELQKKWGRLGAPTIYMPRVNVQYLYLDLMGVENGIFLLMDEKEEAESFFQILEENQERMIKVINQSPIEMINFGDNLHCKSCRRIILRNTCFLPTRKDAVCSTKEVNLSTPTGTEIQKTCSHTPDRPVLTELRRSPRCPREM